MHDPNNARITEEKNRQTNRKWQRSRWLYFGFIQMFSVLFVWLVFPSSGLSSNGPRILNIHLVWYGVASLAGIFKRIPANFMPAVATHQVLIKVPPVPAAFSFLTILDTSQEYYDFPTRAREKKETQQSNQIYIILNLILENKWLRTYGKRLRYPSQ